MEEMPQYRQLVRRFAGGVALLFLTFSAAARADAAPAHVPVVLSAAEAELARSMDQLKQQEIAPYFLSYEIVESHTATVTAAFGALTHSSENKRRVLRVSVHVGDFALDNTRQVRGGAAGGAAQIPIPLEDDAVAIRNVLWYQTDKRYKQAVEELARARTVSQVAVAQEDKSADFSAAPPEQSVEAIAPFSVNRKAWEEKVRRYTAPFQKFGNLYDATASFSANQDTRWFVSSDGSAIQSSQTYFRLQISAFSKADDGMELPRYETYFAYSPEGLPDDAAVLKAVIGEHALPIALFRSGPVGRQLGAADPAGLSGRRPLFCARPDRRRSQRLRKEYVQFIDTQHPQGVHEWRRSPERHRHRDSTFWAPRGFGARGICRRRTSSLAGDRQAVIRGRSGTDS